MKFYLVRFENQEKILFAAACDIGANEHAEERAKMHSTKIEDILQISRKWAEYLGYTKKYWMTSTWVFDANEDVYDIPMGY